MLDKLLIISVLSTICLCGCQCFSPCPDVPKPAKVSPMPSLCYKLLRPADPVQDVLTCYMADIVRLEKAAVEREKALEALR